MLPLVALNLIDLCWCSYCEVASPRSELEAYAEKFMSGLRDRGQIEQMFELLPDIYFYIKDRECRVGHVQPGLPASPELSVSDRRWSEPQRRTSSPPRLLH